ncbi:MAG: ISAzo13 family transposase, partial [Actinomycetia bacterium]|nr:ISAzo13 family transposase [Actinomycetes bacterium]
LARQLTAQGFRVSAELVRRLLHQMGYSLQAPAKQVEGTSYPDRDAQFDYLNKVVAERLGQGEPVTVWTPRTRNWSAAMAMVAPTGAPEATRRAPLR